MTSDELFKLADSILINCGAKYLYANCKND